MGSKPLEAKMHRTPDGDFYRVTEILRVVNKPMLLNWAAKAERELAEEAFNATLNDLLAQSGDPWKGDPLTLFRRHRGETLACNRVSGSAKNTGGIAHDLIQNEIRTKLGEKVAPVEKSSPGASYAFAAWKEWAQGKSFKMPEKLVWSRRKGYAGHFDAIAVIEGETYIADWKAKPNLYPEDYLQSAAYQWANFESNAASAMYTEGGLILRLPTGDGKIKEPVEQFVPDVCADEEQVEIGKPRHYLLDGFFNCVELYKCLVSMDPEAWNE